MATTVRSNADRAHPRELTRGVDALLSLGDLTKLQSYWMALILGDAAPLLERAVLMWHGHFATSDTKLSDVRQMHRHNRGRANRAREWRRIARVHSDARRWSLRPRVVHSASNAVRAASVA